MKCRVIKSFKELLDEDPDAVYIEKKNKEIKTIKDVFKRGPGKKIKGDPLNIGKSEIKIEKEIHSYLDTIPDCAWWITKIKGEIQYVGKNKYVMKKSSNVGFPDILACIKGIFIGIEVKACNKYQSPDQIDQQEKIQKKGGGFYFIVTSVRELIILLVSCGILKESKPI